jgi:hypothetical protein
MHFLHCIVSALLLANVAHSQSCSSTGTRKEIRDLSDGEWTAFAGAVNSLKQSGTYDTFVNLHIKYQNVIHGGSLFWPWHRWLVRQFEIALQTKNANVWVPYWDWAYDSQAPERSVVFQSSRFGGNGKGANNCVQDGAFANWQAVYPDAHCLSRQWDGGNTISSFYSTDVVNSVLAKSTTYAAAEKGIEINPHGAIHVNIGADMSTMGSPNDPLFWVHHAFVDKLWWTWQQTHHNSYGGQNADGSTASVSDILPSYTAKVSDTFDISALCYSYQEMQNTAAPAAPAAAPTPAPPTLVRRRSIGLSRRATYAAAAAAKSDTTTDSDTTYSDTSISSTTTSSSNTYDVSQNSPIKQRYGSNGKSIGILVAPHDRQELVNLRHPYPLPDHWCIRNHIDPQEAAHQRSAYGDITAKVNDIDGYVSPCSLWHREDLLQSITVKQTTFVAVINGKAHVADVDSKKTLRDRVTHVKDQIKTKYGGKVHKDVSVYKSSLTAVIGKSVMKYGGYNY